MKIHLVILNNILYMSHYIMLCCKIMNIIEVIWQGNLKTLHMGVFVPGQLRKKSPSDLTE